MNKRKKTKVLSEPNAPHTAGKHAPELIPDEVIFHSDRTKMTFYGRDCTGLGSTGVATEASLQAISALMAFSSRAEMKKEEESKQKAGRPGANLSCSSTLF